MNRSSTPNAKIMNRSSTPNASKQGRLNSFAAILLLVIFLPCMWGLGFQNEMSMSAAFLLGISMTIINWKIRKFYGQELCCHLAVSLSDRGLKHVV